MKPGPAPDPTIAARNDDWLRRYDAGETVEAIATAAGVAQRTVYKSLRQLGAVMRSRGHRPTGKRPAVCAGVAKPRPEERAASLERRRQYVAQYQAERRTRPEQRAAQRASNASYRTRNRELLRERARAAHVPLTDAERAERAAERHEARGEAALQALLIEAATIDPGEGA